MITRIFRSLRYKLGLGGHSKTMWTLGWVSDFFFQEVGIQDGHSRRKGCLPNVNIITQALLSKKFHKGGRGSKMSKSYPHVLWMTPKKY